MLAVVNGSRLYVVNRFNGDLLYEKTCKYPPGAGAALSSEARLRAEPRGVARRVSRGGGRSRRQEIGQSRERTEPAGQAADRSGATEERSRQTEGSCAGVLPVVWPCDGAAAGNARRSGRGIRGLADGPRIPEPRPHQPRCRQHAGVKYRLQTGATIVARPAYLPPDPKTLGDAAWSLPSPATDSSTPCKKRAATRLWRFSTGEPIVESPAVIDDSVYVATQLGGMYSLDIKNRQQPLVCRERDAVRCRQQDAGVCDRRHAATCWCSAPPAAPGSIAFPPRVFRRFWRIPTPIASTGQQQRPDPVPPRSGADRTVGSQRRAQGGGESRLDAAAEERGQEEKPKKEHVAPKTPTVPKEHSEERTEAEGPERAKPPRRGGRKAAVKTSAIRAISPAVCWALARAGSRRLPNEWESATIHSKRPANE